MPLKRNGSPFNPSKPFTGPDGTQYPANWYKTATPEQRAALNIVEYVRQTPPDQTMYWVTEHDDGSYTATPKELESVKQVFLNKYESMANSIIQQTDTMITEAKEINYPIALNLGNGRKDVREALLKITSGIKNASNNSDILTVTDGFVFPDIYREITISNAHTVTVNAAYAYVNSVSIEVAGAGYVNNETVYLRTGTGSNASFTITTGANSEVVSLVVSNSGNYSVWPEQSNVATSNTANGSGLIVSVGLVTVNAVTANVANEYTVITYSGSNTIISNTDPKFASLQNKIDDGSLLITESLSDLNKAKENKIKLAWTEFERRYETAVVTIPVSAGTYSFGCDKETRDNILGINTAIAIGIPISNPRPWTPQGIVIPIDVTHADLALIGAAILSKKDELINTYFFHKAMISAQIDIMSVANYDYSTGWN